MKIRYAITLLSVILVIILSTQFIVAQGDPFEITGADSSSDLALTTSSSLTDLLDQALSRFVVEQANSVRNNNLQAVPAILYEALEQVAVRVIIQYASSNRYLSLQHPKALLNDTTSPVISNIEVWPIPGGHMRVTWTTGEFADSEIRFGTQTGIYPETLAETANVKDHALILEGLTVGTTYYFRLKSTDLSDNSAESDENNFVAVLYQPEVIVSKTASPEPVITGQNLTYSIMVTNTGNVPLDLTIVDTLPFQVTPSVPQTWTTQLEISEVWSVTFVVTVQAGYTGLLNNQVQVTSQEGVSDSATVASHVISAETDGIIKGRVTNINDESLAGIRVEAHRLVGTEWIYAGANHTLANGTYTISIPPGTYRVYFMDLSQTYIPEYFDNAGTFNQAQNITVQTQTDTSNIDAVLEEPPPPPVDTVTGCLNMGINPQTGEMILSMRRGCQGDVTITHTRTCDNGATPSNVTLRLGDNTFPMVSVGNDQYQVTLNIPNDLPNSNGPYILSFEAQCGPDMIPITVIIIWYDPSGFIRDAATNNPITGAIVNLYRIPNALPDKSGQTNQCRTVDTRPTTGNGIYGSWSGLAAAELGAGVWLNPALVSSTSEISPTVNPQITSDEGYYGWDVVEGCWYVSVTAEGYESLFSPIVGVPPAVTDLDITLSPKPDTNSVYLPLIVK